MLHRKIRIHIVSRGVFFYNHYRNKNHAVAARSGPMRDDGFVPVERDTRARQDILERGFTR